MINKCIKPGTELSSTGFGYTMSLLSGKYKMIVLYWLAGNDMVRYGELKRKVGGVSHKTLSLTLKELEYDNLIIRKEYPQVPPKVEYSLSELGKSLIPILDALCEWGELQRRPE